MIITGMIGANMQELSRQQKQEALDALIKKLRDGNIPTQDESIPMQPAPMDEMTPEKAAELDKGRGPASIGSDMTAVPLEEFMPQGAYMAQKGMSGQESSPDVSGMSPAPEMDDKVARLAKIKALFQNRDMSRIPNSVEEQPTLNQQKKFIEEQGKLEDITGKTGVPTLTPSNDDLYYTYKMNELRKIKNELDSGNTYSDFLGGNRKLDDSDIKWRKEKMDDREYWRGGTGPFPSNEEKLKEWDSELRDKIYNNDLTELLKSLKNQR